MSASGYKTSASCQLRVMHVVKPTLMKADLVDISPEGAVVLCQTPLPVGSTHLLSIDGYQMAELPVQVQANGGDTGSGYRLTLRLANTSWPYHVFSSLTMLAFSSEPTRAPTPPCLKELGLTLPCSTDEIERAFHRKVRTAHPDRGGEVEAFVRLRSAYREALELVSGN